MASPSKVGNKKKNTSKQNGQNDKVIKMKSTKLKKQKQKEQASSFKSIAALLGVVIALLVGFFVFQKQNNDSFMSRYLKSLSTTTTNTTENTCSTDDKNSDGTCMKDDNDEKLLVTIHDLGEKQNIIQGFEKQIQQVVQESLKYMNNVVYKDIVTYPEKVRNICKNKSPDCSYWAHTGECDKLPGYMHVNCAPACQTCEKILFETRCPMPAEEELLQQNVWKPGDLNKMFERITTEEKYVSTYQPEILSSPSSSEGDTDDGPWVVLLHNIATPDECKRLIELGYQEKYIRSSEVGKIQDDGTNERVRDSQRRTSTNAWCQSDACANDTTVTNVMDRILDLTRIPYANGEYLQLLRYDVGEFYSTHNDYIEHEINRPQGPRIITVFLYLNHVIEGGGTNFPQLNITVTPSDAKTSCGKAIIWPSVLNDNPLMKDKRTSHEALPVKKGIKYGTNAWFHQRDFKTPNKNNCQ